LGSLLLVLESTLARRCLIAIITMLSSLATSANDLVILTPTSVQVKVDGVVTTAPILYLESAAPVVEVTADFQVTWNCDIYFPGIPPFTPPSCTPARPSNLVAALSHTGNGQTSRDLGQLAIQSNEIAWRNWMNNPFNSSKIDILLDPEDLIAEDINPDETNAEKIGLQLIGGFNGELRFGSAVANVTDVVAINQPGSCAVGQVELVQAQVSYDPGSSWDTATTSQSVICGEPVADVDGIALTAW